MEDLREQIEDAINDTINLVEEVTYEDVADAVLRVIEPLVVENERLKKPTFLAN
jgi:hypothetical protein